ncbi:hypothetical protein FNV43_RR08446 [Rhamnella rubrinervis]|uniref:non-specific serine/threonine protein kinase n=1 Tax=Rhamnella rubrinervis TaxID=2594499 RepID=A0A8K0MJ95_9ROSA|nr:hypothetical protein FNV43_RR08446 [Rhamnella rubrinervis]
MFSKLLITLSTFLLVTIIEAGEDLSFTYNGFKSANLSLDGIAEFTPSGLLRLTNGTQQQKGHAFYPNPVTFKNSMINSTAFSFSTTFVFAIRSEYPTLSGHGICFVIAPTRGLPGALPSHSEFDDVNDNHVGIDINGLKSADSSVAGYYEDKNGGFKNLTLISGRSMKVWVEFNGEEKQMNVTLAPSTIGKPHTPLLSLTRDLSSIVNNTMYVGFSSSTGSVLTSHYILGWSFKINGQAQELVLSQLPKLPRMGKKDRTPILQLELVEDWEVNSDYGTQRYKYKDLYIATKGFRDQELLGTGGFGAVYRGILPTSNVEIAVKRVSHESRQGMREFVAEIVSMGRLRHRNLVQLLGYCRRKGELMLVYDYMSNGSLDKDVKASNVLLDSEFNARLGDFGLARLYDHGTDPQTTHVVGTLGRPIEPRRAEDVILVDQVYSCWKEGDILAAKDLKLAWCSAEHATSCAVLGGDIPLPNLTLLGQSSCGFTFASPEGFDDFAMSYPYSMDKAFSYASASVTESSLLSGGR